MRVALHEFAETFMHAHTHSHSHIAHRDTGGNLQARELAHCRAREAVHGVCADLESQLPAIQHRVAEGVLLVLHVRLGALAGSEEVFKNLRQET